MIERLSDRVSVDRSEGRLSVVISARIASGKRALLLAWSSAWLLIGIAVLVERSRLPAGDPLRQYLLAFMAFWVYYAVKVGRALLWRLKGLELWRVKDDALTIKDSIFGYGKAHRYFVANITALGRLAVDRDSWRYQFSNSFWTIGGETLGFQHLGKRVAFGKGLDEEEVRQLVQILQQALKEARKRA